MGIIIVIQLATAIACYFIGVLVGKHIGRAEETK